MTDNRLPTDSLARICKHCEHWEAYAEHRESSVAARCHMIGQTWRKDTTGLFAYLIPTQRQEALGFPDETMLFTHPDFGCVLWEQWRGE